MEWSDLLPTSWSGGAEASVGPDCRLAALIGPGGSVGASGHSRVVWAVIPFGPSAGPEPTSFEDQRGLIATLPGLRRQDSFAGTITGSGSADTNECGR